MQITPEEAAQWGPGAIEDALNKIFDRARKDKDFHARALKDPRAAVKEVTGKEIPAGLSLRFVSNEGADQTYVLPDMADPSGELSDSELEQVAGGGKCAATMASVCGLSVTLTIGIPTVGGVGACL